MEIGLRAVVVEEVCALPLVDTATGNEAAGVEAGAVGNDAAAVDAASVGSDGAAVDSAASVVDAEDPKGQQPSEPSGS